VRSTVALDAGPLGLVTNSRISPQSLACAQWLQALVASGVQVILPEISDYEVRRELLRAQKVKGIERLDSLAGLVQYLPLSTTAIGIPLARGMPALTNSRNALPRALGYFARADRNLRERSGIGMSRQADREGDQTKGFGSAMPPGRLAG
jgi:hypothetical protein